MTNELTTLNGILETLEVQDANLPLVFVTEEGEIGGGYHVTELKQTWITSIDCGGNVDDWRETHVQLLDGQSGDHMSVGKFAAIAAKSMGRLHELGKAPLYFEFALKNKGLRRYQVASLIPGNAKISILLSEGRAMCKPALASKTPGHSSGCCGGNDTSSGCCT